MGGSFNNFLAGPAPGTVDPFSLQALAQATQQGILAMNNRYDQLGERAPAGSPQAAAAIGASVPAGGRSTPNKMDIGSVPSLVGGIPAMSAATLGQMQTNALSNPTGSGGKTGANLLNNIF